MPVTFTCVKIDAVMSLARQNADSEGYIDLDAFIVGIKRLHFTERQYKTPLEYIDERDQNPSWPPTGRWPVNSDGEQQIPDASQSGEDAHNT